MREQAVLCLSKGDKTGNSSYVGTTNRAEAIELKPASRQAVRKTTDLRTVALLQTNYLLAAGNKTLSILQEIVMPVNKVTKTVSRTASSATVPRTK